MLSVGDHDFDTPTETVEACVTAVRGGHHHYTQLPGIPRLREAMAKVCDSMHRRPTAADQVIATPGGQSALYAAVQATLDPGDHARRRRALLRDLSRHVPCRRRRLHAWWRRSAEDGFQPRAAAIESSAEAEHAGDPDQHAEQPDWRGLFARDARRHRRASAVEHDLWLLSDEVYWTLGGGDHVSPRALPGMAERTLVINSHVEEPRHDRLAASAG